MYRYSIIMPWTKTCVDSIVDIKKENKNSIGFLLIVLDKIACLFNEMRTLTIRLDNNLTKLRQQVETEGPQTDSFGNIVPYESTVAEYNGLIQQYIYDLATLLKFKVPNECGLAANLIKPWNIAFQVMVYTLNFKMQCYNWINCSKVCVVDNMNLVNPVVLTYGSFPNFLLDCDETINVGSCNVLIPFVQNGINVSGVLSPTSRLLYCNFLKLLCCEVGHNLHQLNALFCKNIEMIESCIKNIKKITTECELLCDE